MRHHTPRHLPLLCAITLAACDEPAAPAPELAAAPLRSAADCPLGTNIMLGTAGDDRIIGTSAADCMLGGTGNDVLDGRGGDDYLFGGAGDDRLRGGDGNDVIAGGGGNDVVRGGDGNDLIKGGPGDDDLDGEAGNDLIVSGGGRDTGGGGAGRDACTGCELPEPTGSCPCARGERCVTAIDICVACRADGACDDGAFCNGDEACQPDAGCFTADPDPCDGAACDEATDVCGTADCSALDSHCTVGVYDPTAGCVAEPAREGLGCDDGDRCTPSDSCNAGTCVAGAAITCTSLDQCHEAGTCDPQTGACSSPPRPDDSPCDDGDRCTPSDACQGGDCVAGASIICTADACHDAGNCDPQTGICSTPPRPEGCVCLADGLEPDDTRATATALASKIVADLSACPDNEDWFQLGVGDNEVIDVAAQFEDSLGDVNLWLYDGAEQLVAYSLSTDADREHLVTTSLAAGDYFLKVLLAGGDDAELPGADYALEVDVGAPCTDAFENNDDRAEAAAIDDGEHLARACPGDPDWYRFDADADDLLRVAIAFTPGHGGVDLALYDATGVLLETSVNGGSGASIAFTAPAGGTYYLRALLAGDDEIPGADYTLTLDTATRCSDIFEDNDASIGATALGAGTFGALTACPRDDDWYALTIADAGVITVDLDFEHALGNVDARLFDDGGQLVAFAYGFSDGEHLEYAAPFAGDYTLVVSLADADADAGNVYGLTILGAEPCAANACDDVGAECGALHDGCGTTLQCGTCAGADVCFGNSCDCVPRDCEAQGKDCGAVDDGCGTTLHCGTCSGADLCAGAHADNVCAPPSCPPDRFEDDDTFATRAPIAAGTHDDLLLCPGDDDHHGVTLASNDLVRITADFTHAHGDLQLRFADPAGNVVADSFGTGDREELVFTAQTAGTHDVWALLGGEGDPIPGVDYTLGVTVSRCSDDFEDNDAPATASPLSSGTYDARACPRDRDWYRLGVAANTLVDVSARFTHALGNVELRLYDPAGNLVTYSLGFADRERVTYTAPVAGDYLLLVELGGPDGGEPGNDYTIEVAVGDPCTDAFEDHDAQTDPADVTPGGYPDLRACPFDEDWYRVAVADNEVLVAEAAFMHADGNLNLRLFDPTGALLDYALGFGNGERIARTAPSAGAYTLRATLDGDDGDPPGAGYDLTIARIPCSDAFENNDSRAGAWELGAGDFSARACPGDQDWYALDVAAGATISAATSYLRQAGLTFLWLYDPSGNLAAFSLDQDSDQFLTRVANVAGTWYLRVDLVDDDASPGNDYTLAIVGAAPCRPTTDCDDAGAECGDLQDGCGASLFCGTCASGGCSPTNICDCQPASCEDLDAACGTPDDGCGTTLFCGTCGAGTLCGGAYDDFHCDAPACTPDALEDDDTFATARTGTDGLYADLTSCAGDDDWVAIEIADDEVILADFSFDNTRGDIDARLYDDAQNLVDYSLGQTGRERIRFTGDAGTYYLRGQFVGPDDAIPGNRYALSLATQPCSDEFEPDDVPDDAPPLSSGTYPGLTSCPDDLDWYELSVGDDALIVIELAFTHAAGDIEANLYDSAGQLVAWSLSQDDDERIVVTTPQAGIYRLRVHLAEGSGDDAIAGNDYTLSLALQELCSDDFENNDTLATASPIIAGSYPSLTACPADRDWYRVDIAAGHRLDVGLDFAHAAGNLDLVVFNPAGVEVASARGLGDDEFLSYPTPAAGPYFVRVELGDDDAAPGNDYTLTFTDAPP